MARTKAPRRYNALEVGDISPLDDNEIPNPADVILKVALTTSAPTLSLSKPDPSFLLILNVEIFHSPQPNRAITVSTGRSAMDSVFTYVLGGFGLVSTTDGPYLLGRTMSPNYARQDFENKDLLRDPHFSWLKFITIPASGSVRVELPLQLERILLQSPGVNDEDLKPGMKYRVWMKQGMLSKVGTYSYWGDLAGDLKDKKLSKYSPSNHDGSRAEQLDYAAEVIAEDGWALQRSRSPVIRGNVGRFGPVVRVIPCRLVRGDGDMQRLRSKLPSPHISLGISCGRSSSSTLLPAPPSRFSRGRAYAQRGKLLQDVPRTGYTILHKASGAATTSGLFVRLVSEPQASGLNISSFKPSSLQISGPEVVKYRISQGFKHVPNPRTQDCIHIFRPRKISTSSRYVDMLFCLFWPCLDLEDLRHSYFRVGIVGRVGFQVIDWRLSRTGRRYDAATSKVASADSAAGRMATVEQTFMS
ncbi:hypothetical protein FB451DRAFT_1515549 [Mycena latifolia]|nr:hypothetical protein FB451DRAFT_1515549 [Mycena latifolia]